MKFAIEPGLNSRESLAIFSCSARHKIDYKITAAPIDAVPIGSVKYCEMFLKHVPKPNFYPDFLKSYLKRDIKRIVSKNAFILSEDIFIKDATSYKTNFESRIYKAGETIPPGEYHISEIVKMINEWRYYIHRGAVLCSGWYDGDDGKEAPDLGFDFPNSFSGAVDFAETCNGIMLVESHAPYACGWYGDNHIDYVNWQYLSWSDISS